MTETLKFSLSLSLIFFIFTQITIETNPSRALNRLIDTEATSTSSTVCESVSPCVPGHRRIVVSADRKGRMPAIMRTCRLTMSAAVSIFRNRLRFGFEWIWFSDRLNFTLSWSAHTRIRHHQQTSAVKTRQCASNTAANDVRCLSS